MEIVETTMEKVETHVAVVGTLESERLGPTGMVWLVETTVEIVETLWK